MKKKKKSTFGRAVVSDTTCHQIFNCFNCNYFFFLMSKDVICVKIEQLSLSFFLVAMMTYLCLVRTKQMLQKEHLPDYCIWIICVCVCVFCVFVNVTTVNPVYFTLAVQCLTWRHLSNVQRGTIKNCSLTEVKRQRWAKAQTLQDFPREQAAA